MNSLVFLFLLPLVAADCFDDKEELTACLDKATCSLRTASHWGCTVSCPRDCQDLTEAVYSSCSGENDWDIALKHIVKTEVEMFGCSGSPAGARPVFAILVLLWAGVMGQI